MQPVWLCIISGKSFEETYEKTHRRKSPTNATCVTMQHLTQAVWRYTWKNTLEKSPINAASVTMHHLGQVIWGHTWKSTLEKSPTNAACVTMHHLRQVIWGHTWKNTLEKSQTVRQGLWRHKYENTQQKPFLIVMFYVCNNSNKTTFQEKNCVGWQESKRMLQNLDLVWALICALDRQHNS